MDNLRRSKARYYALQALYQWQMTKQDVVLIQDQFLEEEGFEHADMVLFTSILKGVTSNLQRLDQELQPLISRHLEQVDPVERAILRMGAFELIEHSATPYRVVINEAVELAKTFGAEQGHRYVNGVLDRLARNLRGNEVVANAS